MFVKHTPRGSGSPSRPHTRTRITEWARNAFKMGLSGAWIPARQRWPSRRNRGSGVCGSVVFAGDDGTPFPRRVNDLRLTLP
jgi:hypothetical protein